MELQPQVHAVQLQSSTAALVPNKIEKLDGTWFLKNDAREMQWRIHLFSKLVQNLEQE